MSCLLWRCAKTFSIYCFLWMLAAPLQAAIERQDFAPAITEFAQNSAFPARVTLPDEKGVWQLGYTFDPALHEEMAKVYLQYQPDYACFVAMDANTGAILNLTSFLKQDEALNNLVFRAEYPAASVFKYVTAAAALDTLKLSTHSVIPYNGKSTSLYKSQVLRHKETKWTRKPTLVEAFAKSVNPVFGRIGARVLGQNVLTDYAHRFGFDQSLTSDFHLAQSKIALDFEDQWQLAEAGSGYTKDIRLSPVHAAQMMSTLFNEGKMVTPYLVNSARRIDERGAYLASPQYSQEPVISSDTTKKLRELMRATIKVGSARSAFQGINRYKVYKGVEIGGKTGSLTGDSPKGRHDWFVGYASDGERNIVFASLIVNKEKWVVRSAYVARQFIYHYFKQQQSLAQSAAN
ncbi:MAG: penicillin-binding transpeptidase domain-containing protein [Pseudomonadota bacterium]